MKTTTNKVRTRWEENRDKKTHGKRISVFIWLRTHSRRAPHKAEQYFHNTKRRQIQTMIRRRAACLYFVSSRTQTLLSIIKVKKTSTTTTTTTGKNNQIGFSYVYLYTCVCTQASSVACLFGCLVWFRQLRRRKLSICFTPTISASFLFGFCFLSVFVFLFLSLSMLSPNSEASPLVLSDVSLHTGVWKAYEEQRSVHCYQSRWQWYVDVESLPR